MNVICFSYRQMNSFIQQVLSAIISSMFHTQPELYNNVHKCKTIPVFLLDLLLKKICHLTYLNYQRMQGNNT